LTAIKALGALGRELMQEERRLFALGEEILNKKYQSK
jgi:hypothetical protein